MKELTNQEYISTQLIKFNVTDSAISELSKQSTQLVIDGPSDKQGYNAVHSKRMEIRSLRVSVDKKEKRAC